MENMCRRKYMYKKAFVCPLHMSSSCVPSVYPLRVSPLFVLSVYPLCVSYPCIPFVYPLPVGPSCLPSMCVFLPRVSPSVSPSVCPIRVSLLCAIFIPCVRSVCLFYVPFLCAPFVFPFCVTPINPLRMSPFVSPLHVFHA